MTTYTISYNQKQTIWSYNGVSWVSGTFAVPGSAIGPFSQPNSGGPNNTVWDDYVGSGDIATGLVESGTFYIDDGVASAVTVGAGGVLEGTDILGSASDIVIEDGGSAEFECQAAVVSATIASGDYLTMDADGSVSNLIVENGGEARFFDDQLTPAGATLSGATISSGGYLDMDNESGSASGVVIESGADAYLYCSAIVTSATVASGDYLDMYGGGSASHVVVESGGDAYLGCVATVTSATVGSSDYLEIYESAGSASDVVVDSGGYAYFDCLAVVESATIASGDSLDLMNSGGSASDVVLESGGDAEFYCAATVNSATIGYDDKLKMYNGGGSASDVVLDAGGDAMFDCPASVISATVGYEDLLDDFLVMDNGGSASDVYVEAYAEATFGNSVSLSSATVTSSGTIYLLGSGGSASNLVADGGDIDLYGSNWVASNILVDDGGYLDASDGVGDIAKEITVSGGEAFFGASTVGLTVDGGGVNLVGNTKGTITLVGNENGLGIYGTIMPSALIAGLSSDDTIDLANIAYVASSEATVLEKNGPNYTLQVWEGGKAYDLQIALPPNFSGGFQLSSNGGSGTDVTVSTNAETGYSTSVSPYDDICRIAGQVEYSDWTPWIVDRINGTVNSSPATGFYIGQHFILTADHVVASNGKNNLADEIKMFLGNNGTNAGIAISPSEVALDSSYDNYVGGVKSHSDEINDIAIIYTPSITANGWFDLGSSFNAGILNITGYALRTPQNTSNTSQINYVDSMNSSAQSSAFISYKPDGGALKWLPGDSGGPDWISSGGAQPTAYGLTVTDYYALAFTGGSSGTLAEINALKQQALEQSGVPTFSISDYLANSTDYNKLPSGLEISGTASALTSDLDQLNDSSIAGIVISDSAAITTNVAEITSDAAALSILFNANGGAPAQIDVADTAANVRSGLATLAGDASNIASITATAGAVTVSVDDDLAYQAALDLIAGGFAVTDTGADISANLAALDDPNIASIKISDNADITVSASQLTSDAKAIGKLANANGTPYQLSVSDTAVDIETDLSAIVAGAAHVASIKANRGTVTVSVATFLADESTLDKISGGFAVFDTATNLAAHASALNADSPVISKTAISGSPPVVSAAQYLAAQTALDAGASGVSLSDTAANLSAIFTTLNVDTRVKAIVISDNNAVSGVTAGELTIDAATLAKLADANGTPYQLAVTDTAADIDDDLTTLLADTAHLASITISDNLPIGSVTVADLSSDATTFAKLLNADGDDYQLAISDTGADVEDGLPTLASDAAHIGSISLTSGAVAVSVATYLNSPSIFDNIVQGFGIVGAAANISASLNQFGDDNLTSVTVSDNGVVDVSIAELDDDATAFGVMQNADGSPFQLAVSDTADDVAGALDGLEGVVSHIQSITLTDGGTPVLYITQTQAINDASAIAKIVSHYTLSISNEGVYDASAFTAAQVQVSINPSGSIAFVSPNDEETLTGITTINLDDAVITVSGNVLTEKIADGSKVVSTFNITGQAFTSKAISYDAAGQVVSKLYAGVTGEGNLSSFEYLYDGGNLVGTDDFYTGIASRPYTKEEVDYDGAGRLIRAAFSGLTSAPYSSYQYDYVGGVFSGSEFTYTSVPTGASYSSYVVDYNQTSALSGLAFFFTDLSDTGYSGEEADFNASGSLTRVLLTGVDDQPYSSLELDYSEGTYEGYKAFYDITGQKYDEAEVDVSAAGKLEKVVYSGLTGAPYQSVEQDYAAGVLEDTIYSYTDVSGETYYAYQVKDNAAGAALQETFDLNNGGHNLIALATNQTLTSLGGDKMTGDGATTFVLDAIYGSDVITNFGSGDTVSLPSAEYAGLSRAIAVGAYAGGSATLSFSDGDTLIFKNMTEATLDSLSARFNAHA